MKKEKVYLDTSVISAYYDKREKQRQLETVKFFKEILPRYEVYISDIVARELTNLKSQKLKKKFKRLIKNFKILKINDKVKKLAKAYINKEIFPKKYFDDALHIAIASYYKIDYLISWNFEHIVKVRTRRLVNFVNSLNKIKEIEIISPLEL